MGLKKKITEIPRGLRKFGDHWFSLKSGPKLGSKTSLTFLVVGYIFVLGLYNIIGGVRKKKEEEEEEEKKKEEQEEVVDEERKKEEEKEIVVEVILIIMVIN